MTERERLIAELAEARLRLRDLTRELDESMAAEEHDAMFVKKLERARECVIELAKALEDLRV